MGEATAACAHRRLCTHPGGRSSCVDLAGRIRRGRIVHFAALTGFKLRKCLGNWHFPPSAVPLLPHWSRNYPVASGVSFDSPRAELPMADKRTDGYLGAVLGGIVVLAAAAFLLTGGEWGGKKKVEGDDDLPPVIATPNQR